MKCDYSSLQRQRRDWHSSRQNWEISQRDYRLILIQFNFPRGFITEKHEKFMLANYDILIAMTGATAGKVGRICCSEEQILLLNQRVAKFNQGI